MTQSLAFIVVLLLLALPLGLVMAKLYAAPRFAFERRLYPLLGIAPDAEMTWAQYARAVLLFNALGAVALYAMLRAVQPAELAFNTAVSFVTNTNWQSYAGETLPPWLQTLGLTVQNFVSAGTGMAVLVALVRGFTRRSANGIGNFWVDLTRSTLFILLPLSVLLALLLLGQGVVQTMDASLVLDGQTFAVGPAASQVAIKQLGTNGGGFFNANSAHPFENPTPLSNFFELVAIVLIPAALCFTFGELVKDRRQGVALLAAMLVLFIPLLVITTWAEAQPNPALSTLGVDQSAGNLEGKETRFGAEGSALWAVVTTAASNGSVNAMHDSFTPIGGLVPMWLMQLGEIIFGGVGSGLYGMLVYALIAVFIAGLMVGRTPEYLGKKIEAAEMKMASLVILVPASAVLIGTAIACVVPAGSATLGNPGAHGFSEMLYAFTSAANNNGSAFGGLTASGPFYATALGVCMLVGRFWVLVPVLAIAGSLAKKKHVPPSSGTLPTHTPLFVALLVGTIVLVGALTFIPALALGPVVEHLTWSRTP